MDWRVFKLWIELRATPLAYPPPRRAMASRLMVKTFTSASAAREIQLSPQQCPSFWSQKKSVAPLKNVQNAAARVVSWTYLSENLKPWWYQQRASATTLLPGCALICIGFQFSSLSISKYFRGVASFFVEGEGKIHYFAIFSPKLAWKTHFSEMPPLYLQAHRCGLVRNLGGVRQTRSTK